MNDPNFYLFTSFFKVTKQNHLERRAGSWTIQIMPRSQQPLVAKWQNISQADKVSVGMTHPSRTFQVQQINRLFLPEHFTGFICLPWFFVSIIAFWMKFLPIILFRARNSFLCSTVFWKEMCLQQAFVDWLSCISRCATHPISLIT